VVEFQERNVSDEIVEQRTAAHYMEGDKEQKWPGLEGVELCRWILGNLGEQMPAEAAARTDLSASEATGLEKEASSDEPLLSEEPLTAISAEPEETMPHDVESSTSGRQKTMEKKPAVKKSIPGKAPVKISVQKLRINQPPHTLAPLAVGQENEPFAGDVLGGIPFALEAFFALKEMPTGNGLEKFGYHAEFYARDRSSGRTQLLGDSTRQKLSTDESNYVAILPKVVLPSGTYCLQVLVTVETTPAARGYLTAPLLHVI